MNAPGPASWIGETHRFVYRKSVKGGHEFVMVDADTQQRRPAFDHARLAEALTKAGIADATALKLPFSEFRFTDDEQAITFTAQDARWTCRVGAEGTDTTERANSCTRRDSPAPPPGALRGVNGPVRGPFNPPSAEPRRSPDGKWEAVVVNHNMAIRPVAGGKPELLSTNGTDGDAYELASVAWSPDSTQLAAYRVRAGHRRTVHYVESSPEDQLQPRPWTLQYAKPGDVLDIEQPSIFHVASRKQIPVANDLFPNPYELSPLTWRKDGRAVTFEYNQRGHQVYRVIEVDAATGKARTVLAEEPKDVLLLQQRQ